MIAFGQARQAKVCHWWTCPVGTDLVDHQFLDSNGKMRRTWLCVEHAAKINEALRISGLPVTVTEEGWVMADTFSWHLKFGKKP